MAYSGSTAATTSANPPRLITDGGLYGRSGATTGLTTAPNAPNAQGGRIWSYVSTNLTTDMNAASNTFIADGDDLGMAPGDVVMAIQVTGSAGSSAVLSFHVVTGVSTSGASLSTGAVISSTYS